MTVHICTIIARNYLAAARVLGQSIRETNPSATLHTLIIDDVYGLVDDLQEPFTVLRLSDIGFDAAENNRFAAIYGVTEFATAVKPWLLSTLLERFNEPVIYLDPDIMVFDSLEQIVDYASHDDIVLTPHVTDPMPRDNRRVSESEVLHSGVYNLGFIAVGCRATAFLDFWKERLRRDCISDLANARFVDQRWVDFAPSMFNVKILRDTTFNVAYWNLFQRDLQWINGRYFVDGAPLHFFHFSGYSPKLPELLSKYQGGKARVLLSERPSVARICDEYRHRLIDMDFENTSKIAYAYASLSSGLELTPFLRRIYREALVDAENQAQIEPPNPFNDPDLFVDWLNTPRRGRRLSRYLAELHDNRPDIQAYLPDADGSGYEFAMKWAMNEVVEGFIDFRLVPKHFAPEIANVDHDPTSSHHTSFEKIPGIRVAGYLRAENGVGQLARLAVEAVRASGIAYSTLIDDKPRVRQDHRFVSNERGDLNVNIVTVNADQLPFFAERAGSKFFDGCYTIGLWAWELEDFPEKFSEAFEFVDEVWALSEFTRKAISSVTDKPVFAFPVPILLPDRPSVSTREEAFTFLFCFDLESIFERKNPLGLISAFTHAFEPNEGPRLVIKALNGEHHLAELERMKLAATDRPDIVILDQYLDAEENKLLMASSDCYVSLHRSEGLGLTIAEAMSLGKPVIATAYSGNLDFMVDGAAYFVPFSYGAVPKGCDPYPDGTRWAEPDLDAASELMRYVFENQIAAKEVGERARTHIGVHHSASASAPFVTERFNYAQRVLEGRRASSEVEILIEEDFPPPQVPPLIELALRRPAATVSIPHRFPRLSRLFGMNDQRISPEFEQHQHEMNLALAMGTEHLARLRNEMQSQLEVYEDQLQKLRLIQLKDIENIQRDLVIEVRKHSRSLMELSSRIDAQGSSVESLQSDLSTTASNMRALRSTFVAEDVDKALRANGADKNQFKASEENGNIGS